MTEIVCFIFLFVILHASFSVILRDPLVILRVGGGPVLLSSIAVTLLFCHGPGNGTIRAPCSCKNKADVDSSPVPYYYFP